MSKKYKHEGEVLALVRSFEDATVSRDDWKHAEHLVVALYYLSHHDMETATTKMREGILNRIEHGVRAYDPCLSCSTHAVGQMPLHVQLVGVDGEVIDEARRD